MEVHAARASDAYIIRQKANLHFGPAHTLSPLPKLPEEQESDERQTW